MLKQFLDEKGVEYESVDVSVDSDRAQEMIEKSGQMGVPVADVNGKIIVGFNKEEITAALGGAASAPAEGASEETKEEASEEKAPEEEAEETSDKPLDLGTGEPGMAEA